MTIDNKLQKDIIDYCAINDLDVDTFLNKILRKALNTEKYGEKPPFFEKKDNHVRENDKFVETEQEVKEEQDEKVVSKDTNEENIVMKVKKPSKRPTKRSLS